MFIDFAKDVTYKEWYIMMLLQTICFRLCNRKTTAKKLLFILENAGYCLNSTFMSYKSDHLLEEFQKELLTECARNNVYFFLEERCPSGFAQLFIPKLNAKSFFIIIIVIYASFR